MRNALAALALLFAAGAAAQPLYPGLDGAELRAAIRADYTPARTLGYGPARDSLYTYEQRANGAVCGVYTRFCVTLTPGQDASVSAFQQGVNAEHTWPQSRGAEAEPQRSNVHILYPAKDNVNSSRGNHPYGEVPDAEADAWYRVDASQSTVPTVFLDEWSEKDNAYPGTAYSSRFEPREDAGGNVARAAAYFAVVYESAVDNYDERGFLTVQLADLRAWNVQDAPDNAERARSAYIAGLQGAENPFVIDPTLMDRAFTDYGGSTTPGDGDGGGDGANPAVVWVNEVHYDNAGGDAGEFIELAGIAGTDLAGYRLVLHSGNGGAFYDDRTLSGVVPDEGAGYGAVAFTYPANGIQNGAPDGIALVDDGGELVQFLSYEGVFDATDGPAAGTTSEDIGVEENGGTEIGQSVQLTGTGRRYGDYAWTGPLSASPGTLNAGQTVGVDTPTERGPVAAALAVALYPNPVRGAATVAVTARTAGPVTVAVYDALGRRVQEAEGRAAAGETVRLGLDLSGLPAGVYLVVVADASGGRAAVRAVVAR